MNRRVFLLAALALSGCAGGIRVMAPVGAPLAELEPLYRADADRHALTISVASNGCTTREDFAFYVERKGETATLAFGRKRLDTCKSFARGRIDLRFTWEELGLPPRTAVFLLNPMTAWRGPAA